MPTVLMTVQSKEAILNTCSPLTYFTFLVSVYLSLSSKTLIFSRKYTVVWLKAVFLKPVDSSSIPLSIQCDGLWAAHCPRPSILVAHLFSDKPFFHTARAVYGDACPSPISIGRTLEHGTLEALTRRWLLSLSSSRAGMSALNVSWNPKPIILA